MTIFLQLNIRYVRNENESEVLIGIYSANCACGILMAVSV